MKVLRILIEEKVKDLSNTKALILDLRTDAGDLGSLANAVKVSDLFLNGGTVLETLDPHGYVNKYHASGNPIYTKPVVCLINNRTSTMTEVIAAALKESGGAALVGERTYGNGKLQRSNILDDGSLLMLPMELILTPGGKSFTGVGIEPTVKVSITESQKEEGYGLWWKTESLAAGNEIVPNSRDLQFAAALEVLRKKKIIDGDKSI